MLLSLIAFVGGLTAIYSLTIVKKSNSEKLLRKWFFIRIAITIVFFLMGIWGVFTFFYIESLDMRREMTLVVSIIEIIMSFLLLSNFFYRKKKRKSRKEELKMIEYQLLLAVLLVFMALMSIVLPIIV